MRTTFARSFDRGHLTIFLVLYALFAGLTLLVLWQQSPSDWKGNWNTAATLGAVTGPFTGAIARHFQGCCLKASLSLFPYCLIFLLGGAALQLIPRHTGAWRPIRLSLWTLGLLGWFGGSLVSFLHAFS